VKGRRWAATIPAPVAVERSIRNAASSRKRRREPNIMTKFDPLILSLSPGGRGEG